ncbi:MAG: CDP-glucose 4,6-dehydratase [Elusimicrobiota bacterium]
MEDLVKEKLFNGIYKDKTVFLTGHTGFKGSWIALWLTLMGADVTGYSLEPPTTPNHFELLKLNINGIIGDIRDKDKLNNALLNAKPDIVFHMAAQPLVRYSYKEPLETFGTNVIGTANVFEVCRKVKNIKAIVNITSDKCYENKEDKRPYKEGDPMGGYDPYSASKGCAELVTASYRNSFFNINEYGKAHNTLLASVRAGNVIGGGDWAEDRLIPDIMRAVSRGKKVIIRNSQATRPWQYVLEPLSGYLMLGQKLLEGKKEFASGWNFGPDNNEVMTVENIVKLVNKEWNDISYEIKSDNNNPHEAGFLSLDNNKAKTMLGWKPVWGIEKTIKKTVVWYKNYYKENRINSVDDIMDYIK